MFLAASRLIKMEITNAPARSWMNSRICFDCDGVLWKGGSLLPKAEALINRLREEKMNVYFITNNSTLSREGFRRKFKKLGLEVEKEAILTTSFVAAQYLKRIPEFRDKEKIVYLIGEAGIQEELTEAGIEWIGGEADRACQVEWEKPDLMDIYVDERVGAVLVGFDRNINYYKIQYAQQAVNSGSLFLCTNRDATTHFTSKTTWAGGGSMVSAILGCTNREPLLLGKPESFLIDYVKQRENCRGEDLTMIGDRLDTDIDFGRRNRMKTVLVLSGVTTKNQLDESTIQPDFVCDSVGDLFDDMDRK